MTQENKIVMPAADFSDETTEQTRKVKWASFVEGEAADFFTGHKLEKMTMEDGNGNKAKLSRQKDGGIKVEYTSTITL